MSSGIGWPCSGRCSLNRTRTLARRLTDLAAGQRDTRREGMQIEGLGHDKMIYIIVGPRFAEHLRL
jgi:hypothetical protein